MGDSPAVILFDLNGNPVNTSEGVAVGSTKSLLGAAQDASGNARVIRVSNTNPGSTDYGQLVRVISTQGTTILDGAGTNKLAIDSSGRAAIQNPPNLDVALSSVLASLGQKNSAGSSPVVIASDQSAVPVSGTVGISGTANVSVTNASLAVTASSLPLPTGAATSAKQPALGTAGTPSSDVITVQGASSMVALKVDGSGFTQPVSIAGTVAVSASSLPLPTGAATSALQTTGNSTLTSLSGQLPTTLDGSGFLKVHEQGTANVSVQNSSLPVTQSGSWTVTANVGTTNGLALDSTVSTVQGSVPGGTAGTKSSLAGGVFNSAAPSLTNGQQAAVQLDSSGNLKVNVISGGGSNASVGATGSAVPASATYAGMNVSGNLTGLTGTANGLKVDGSAVTQPVSINAGTNLIGKVGIDQTTVGTTNAVSVAQIGATTVSTGSGVMGAGSLRVTIASNNDALAVTQSGTWTVGNTESVAQGSTTSGEKGFLSMGAVTTSAPSYTNAQTSPVSMTTGGSLRVDASSSATLPLPTGAATSANQTSVIGSAAGGTAGASSELVGGVFNTVAPTLTNGQQAAVQLDSSGFLKVNVVAGGTGSNASVSATGSAVPASATYAGMNVSGNLTGLTGTANGLKVDGSAVTQPVSASALPLPTGAATDSTLSTMSGKLADSAAATAADSESGTGRLQVSGTTRLLDTAQTAGSQLVTAKGDQTSGMWVNVKAGAVTANIGTTNGLALDATVSGLQVAQASTTSGQNGPLVQGAVSTAAPTYTNLKTSPLSLTTAGALRVDASATTQPVSAASLPLPTGAATSAKQPALGTAGSASADVITVQGIASMTALKVDGSAVVQPVSGTVTVTFPSLVVISSASTTGTSQSVTSGTQIVAANSARNALYLMADPTNTVNIRFLLAASGSSSTSFPLLPGTGFTLEPLANGKIYTGAVYAQAEDGATSSKINVIEL